MAIELTAIADHVQGVQLDAATRAAIAAGQTFSIFGVCLANADVLNDSRAIAALGDGADNTVLLRGSGSDRLRLEVKKTNGGSYSNALARQPTIAGFASGDLLFWCVSGVFQDGGTVRVSAVSVDGLTGAVVNHGDSSGNLSAGAGGDAIPSATELHVGKTPTTAQTSAIGVHQVGFARGVALDADDLEAWANSRRMAPMRESDLVAWGGNWPADADAVALIGHVVAPDFPASSGVDTDHLTPLSAAAGNVVCKPMDTEVLTPLAVSAVGGGARHRNLWADNPAGHFEPATEDNAALVATVTDEAPPATGAAGAASGVLEAIRTGTAQTLGGVVDLIVDGNSRAVRRESDAGFDHAQGYAYAIEAMLPEAMRLGVAFLPAKNNTGDDEPIFGAQATILSGSPDDYSSSDYGDHFAQGRYDVTADMCHTLGLDNGTGYAFYAASDHGGMQGKAAEIGVWALKSTFTDTVSISSRHGASNTAGSGATLGATVSRSTAAAATLASRTWASGDTQNGTTLPVQAELAGVSADTLYLLEVADGSGNPKATPIAGAVVDIEVGSGSTTITLERDLGGLIADGDQIRIAEMGWALLTAPLTAAQMTAGDFAGVVVTPGGSSTKLIVQGFCFRSTEGDGVAVGVVGTSGRGVPQRVDTFGLYARPSASGLSGTQVFLGALAGSAGADSVYFYTPATQGSLGDTLETHVGQVLGCGFDGVVLAADIPPPRTSTSGGNLAYVDPSLVDHDAEVVRLAKASGIPGLSASLDKAVTGNNVIGDAADRLTGFSNGTSDYGPYADPAHPSTTGSRWNIGIWADEAQTAIVDAPVSGSGSALRTSLVRSRLGARGVPRVAAARP